MWTRAELKIRAKQVLRKSYWKAFLVSLLLAVVTGGFPGCSSRFGGRGGGNASAGQMHGVPDAAAGFGHLGAAWIALILIAIFVGIVIVLAVFAFQVFVGHPLEVGARQYFKQAAQDDANMNELGFAFTGGRYWPVVKAMLLRAVYRFLWSLLLIVPGIVKSYSYSMVPYILADNPGIGAGRAIELSRHMARGHKWNMFVLDLSFIGWYLLGIVALFVGVLFVLPYYNATKAELYLVLRRQALDHGLCSKAELNMPEWV